jgi:hypothetical protein
MCYDLFGEIPVTLPECLLWVEIVAPRIGPDPRRIARYIVDWNVPEKVREAKRRGVYNSITARDL